MRVNGTVRMAFVGVLCLAAAPAQAAQTSEACPTADDFEVRVAVLADQGPVLQVVDGSGELDRVVVSSGAQQVEAIVADGMASLDVEDVAPLSRSGVLTYHLLLVPSPEGCEVHHFGPLEAGILPEEGATPTEGQFEAVVRGTAAYAATMVALGHSEQDLADPCGFAFLGTHPCDPNVRGADEQQAPTSTGAPTVEVGVAEAGGFVAAATATCRRLRVVEPTYFEAIDPPQGGRGGVGRGESYSRYVGGNDVAQYTTSRVVSGEIEETVTGRLGAGFRLRTTDGGSYPINLSISTSMAGRSEGVVYDYYQALPGISGSGETRQSVRYRSGMSGPSGTVYSPNHYSRTVTVTQPLSFVPGFSSADHAATGTRTFSSTITPTERTFRVWGDLFTRSYSNSTASLIVSAGFNDFDDPSTLRLRFTRAELYSSDPNVVFTYTPAPYLRCVS